MDRLKSVDLLNIMTAKAFKIPVPRMLVLTMSMVVVSFLMATIITRQREATIENRLKDLVGNALPSILHLSNARNHLRDVLVNVDQTQNSNSEHRLALLQNILSQEQDMRASFRTYLTLPFFPDEPAIASGVEQQEENFSESLKRFINSISTNQLSRTVAFKDVHAQGILLDQAFFRIVDFDTSQGQRLGLEISSIRLESLFLSILLNFICVALAGLATVIAIRIKNSSVRVLEDRANELESFAGRVAHDLKNPLNAILMNNLLLNRLNADKATSEITHRITVTGKRMTQIIDGLLDFARSGRCPEINCKADLGAIIDSTLLTVRPDADNVNVHIQVEHFQRPQFLACSDGVLNSILSNLIRNALKYIVDGDSNERRISIRVTSSSKIVRIEIEDNGPGIEPSKLSAIFEPYFRVSSKRPGIGLGLTTVKRLVESHKGKFGVTSTLGKGSCFWFELPKAR